MCLSWEYNTDSHGGAPEREACRMPVIMDTRRMMTSSNGSFFPRYWPFVWGLQGLPMNAPHKGSLMQTSMFL